MLFIGSNLADKLLYSILNRIFYYKYLLSYITIPTSPYFIYTRYSHYHISFPHIRVMSKSIFDIFPPGYRFCPTDEQLCFYLKNKINGELTPLYTINTDRDNIYACEPWNLNCKLYILFSFNCIILFKF